MLFKLLALRLRRQVCPLYQLLERLLELFLRVHHDRTVPSHRLLQRLPRDQEKPDPVLSGLYLQFIAPIEEYERAIVSLRWRCRVQPTDTFRRHSQWPRCVTELPSACKHVRKSVTSCLHRKGLPPSRRNRHIEVNWLSGDSVDRTALPPKDSGYDPNAGTVVVLHFGDVDGLHLLITRRRHF